MQYAIELYFDKETEKILFELAKGIAEKGISTKFLEWKTRPHLTLACFNDVDETEGINRIKQFAHNHQKIPAYLSSIGMFKDTKAVYISPVMNHAMYQFQRELHETFDGFDTKGWEWYCPDAWVPHCTVALTKDDHDEAFYKACDFVLREFQKIVGRFESVGLVKISFPVEEIFTVGLCDIEIP